MCTVLLGQNCYSCYTPVAPLQVKIGLCAFGMPGSFLSASGSALAMLRIGLLHVCGLLNSDWVSCFKIHVNFVIYLFF